MRVATSLSGLLSRQLAASSGTEMKDAEPDTRNHGRIHAKQQRYSRQFQQGQASFWSTPPILTRHGWLIVNHCVSEMAEPGNDGHDLCYSAGVMVGITKRIGWHTFRHSYSTFAEGKWSRHKGHAGTASACVHTRDTGHVHAGCNAGEASGSNRGRHTVLS
jgi:hypothetical protein